MNKLNDSIIIFLLINNYTEDALNLAKHLNAIQHPLFNIPSKFLSATGISKQQELFTVFYKTISSIRKVYFNIDSTEIVYYSYMFGWQIRNV